MENKNTVMNKVTDECGNLVASFTYKPLSTEMVSLFLALIMFLTKNTLTIIFGIFVVAVTIFMKFCVKNPKTISVFETCLFIHDAEDENNGRKVDFEEIKEWSVNNEDNSNLLKLVLNNGENLVKETYQTAEVYKVLNKLIGNKESRKVKNTGRKKIAFGSFFKRK